MKIKEHIFTAIHKITKDNLVLSDFEEDWDEVTPFILNKSKKSLIK